MWAFPFLVLFLKFLPFSSCCGHPNCVFQFFNSVILSFYLSLSHSAWGSSQQGLLYMEANSCKNGKFIPCHSLVHSVGHIQYLLAFIFSSFCLYLRITFSQEFSFSLQKGWSNMSSQAITGSEIWVIFFNLAFPKEILLLVEPYQYITGLSISQNSFGEMPF